MILLIGLVSAINETSLNNTQEKELCQSIYYSVIKVGYDYDKISQLNYSQEDIDSYYFNHYELCVLEGYTNKFPQRQYKEFIVNDTKCEVKEFFFDYTIPFFDINTGELSCKSVKFWNYFFKLEEKNSYSFTDLRIWWILSSFLLVILFSFIKQDSWLNNIIKLNLKRRNSFIKHE